MSCRGWHETYRDRRTDLLLRTSEMGSPPLHRYTTVFTDATELVFLSDEAFRMSERCQVLDVQLGRGADALARAQRQNELALGVLREDLPAAIEGMREELSGLGVGDTQAEAFAAAEETVRNGLIDLDLPVRDAREARAIVAAKSEAGRQGPDALCDSALDDVRQLVELRERRELHNDPVYAVATGLAVIGMFAWVNYVSAPGGPGWNVATIGISVVIVAMIGGLGYRAVAPLFPPPAA